MTAVVVFALVVVGCVSAVPLRSDSAQHVLTELRDTVSTDSSAAATVAFNGGEHWLIGDEAWTRFTSQANPAFPANAPVFKWANTGLTSLSFGQTVMMHADLYASMEPISNGFKVDCGALTASTAAAIDKAAIWSSGSATFIANFGLLQKEMMSGGKEAAKLVGWLQREANAVLNAKKAGSHQASTDGYKAIGALRSQVGEDLITENKNPNAANSMLIPELHAVFSAGRFLALAGENVDHFAPCNKIAYSIGHKLALMSAAMGTADGLSKAIKFEAMAQHFLTDTFSAGHVRVPRAALAHQCGKIGSLGSKAMHDEDGHFGLFVKNNLGEKWTAFGDTRLEDDVSKGNKAKLLEAMVISINEVWGAYNHRKHDLAAFAAFDKFPQIDETAANHAPLIKAAPNGFYFREKDGKYRLIDWKIECALVPIAKLRIDSCIKANKMENGQGPKASA